MYDSNSLFYGYFSYWCFNASMLTIIELVDLDIELHNYKESLLNFLDENKKGRLHKKVSFFFSLFLSFDECQNGENMLSLLCWSYLWNYGICWGRVYLVSYVYIIVIITSIFIINLLSYKRKRLWNLWFLMILMINQW